MCPTDARPIPAARRADGGEAGIERLLHGACVKAGAAAALQVGLDRLPLLRPLVPPSLLAAGSRESVQATQRRLVLAVYRRYGLAPAAWEVEGVLAVARAQAAMTPLATRDGLKALLRGWLPDAMSAPLVRYTPLEPLVTATVAAVASTWAAGRYADSVCRLRKAGIDWLPAPLADALQLAPATLKAWSTEALSVALPPLKLAATLGQRLAGSAARAVASVTPDRKAARAVASIEPKKKAARAVASIAPNKKAARKTNAAKGARSPSKAGAKPAPKRQ